ncbi:unnamed protein product [Adineta steineri]|uniref:Potassium channel tetramerisation-type BTB domain-containing protein n=1 Tax=Adineta steineri TaxID=433720 RepID=A0A819S2P2_9BILA|nr:unnamed protein product [Adineta steineri]
MTTPSVYQRAINEIQRIDYNLTREKEKLYIDRQRFEEEKNSYPIPIDNTDVIQLNVGGEIITTIRETLICIPKSILSIIFNGQWERKIQRDRNGNIFFDFHPILFRHLLHQLQIFDKNNPMHFSPPLDPLLVEPFKKMLRKLGLEQYLPLEKDVINFNIAGKILTHHRKIFNQIANTSFDVLDPSSKPTQYVNSTDVFLDIDLKNFQHLINQLREEPSEKMSCNKISPNKMISFYKMLSYFKKNQRIRKKTDKWKQHGITVAGGHGRGNQLNQLYYPHGIFLDNKKTIYIADSFNHRIVGWKYDSSSGYLNAGGHGEGNRIEQLNRPTDMIIDQQNNSSIICDHRNRRVIRWSHENQQILIADIDCSRMTMDKNGVLYISDYKKNEVKQWKEGDGEGRIVAGGNGQGNHPNQLNAPSFIFIDDDYSLYISDTRNHRVMKWKQDAKVGIIVAGGNGQGNILRQLSAPQGVVIDDFGQIYIADYGNNRVVRWTEGEKEGSLVVGGNGDGKKSNQFSGPIGLLFDIEGNLYVADHGNHRVQKYEIDFDKS